MIVLDDIYLSKSVSNPHTETVRPDVHRPRLSSVTIKWNSLGSLFQTNSYTVLRNTQLTGGNLDTNWHCSNGGDSTTFH